MSESITQRGQNGRYFFTVRLLDSRTDLLIRHIDLLRDATRLCKKNWPFRIDAAVILPSTLHMIWDLPPGDLDYPKRWRMIKSTFSRHVPAPDYVSPSRQGRMDKGIWQKRYWDHAIIDQQDHDLHMHLIITAPVTAGLVRKPSDWPYSSISRMKTIPVLPDAPQIRLASAMG